jgi:hypothetical protein
MSNVPNEILRFSFKNIPQIRAPRFIKVKGLLVRGSRLYQTEVIRGYRNGAWFLIEEGGA